MGGFTIFMIVLGGGTAAVTPLPDPYRPRSYDSTDVRFRATSPTETRHKRPDQAV
jgi:hypothetical protein